MKRVITLLYSALFFGVPLLFYPKTSELFEFNKIILLYAITLGVATLWAVECLQAQKVIFKRTLLDIPFVLFFISQAISTIFSMDQRTSLLGYYSRFNGGLLSTACYLLLYWAFVTHITRKDIPRLFFNLALSSTIAAVWGVLEHFGKSPSCAVITGSLDASCWVQDVQLRVFATFGQPNWMAAWMAAVTPLTWLVYVIEDYRNSKKMIVVGTVLSVVFSAALIFTKSKSGIASFMVAITVFVFLILAFHLKDFKKRFRKHMLIIPLLLGVVIALFGTPWTPTLYELQQNRRIEVTNKPTAGTSLETGGTDSGIIRSIVWQGAVNVWRQYPIFGSGVETFAFSYYKGRPMSHNLVSEWNFLYNKAHNEYLNYLATTGLVGLLSYLGVICGALVIFYRNMKQQKSSDFYVSAALLSGFLSLLITNFFGFSVVPTSVLFYLFPAFAIVLSSKDERITVFKTEGMPIAGIVLVSIASLYSTLMLFNYWHADYLYARAQEAQTNEDYTQSIKDYRSAIALAPGEALYHAQLGALYSDLTTAKEADEQLVKAFTTASLTELESADRLSPENVRILKLIANSYATLGASDSHYLLKTVELTQKLQLMAPTDPSVLYQQCLTLAKLDQISEAIINCESAVTMKPDYKIARRLLAYLYEQTKQPDKARIHLEYILNNISPDDTAVQKELQSLPQK